MRSQATELNTLFSITADLLAATDGARAPNTSVAEETGHRHLSMSIPTQIDTTMRIQRLMNRTVHDNNEHAAAGTDLDLCTDDICNLLQHVEALIAEYKSVKTENIILRNKVNCLKDKADAAVAAYARVRAERNEERDKMRDFEGVQKELQDTVRDLKRAETHSANIVRSKMRAQSRAEMLESQCERASSQLEQAEAEIARLQSSNAHLKALVKEQERSAPPQGSSSKPGGRPLLLPANDIRDQLIRSFETTLDSSIGAQRSYSPSNAQASHPSSRYQPYSIQRPPSSNDVTSAAIEKLKTRDPRRRPQL